MVAVYLPPQKSSICSIEHKIRLQKSKDNKIQKIIIIMLMYVGSWLGDYFFFL